MRNDAVAPFTPSDPAVVRASFDRCLVDGDPAAESRGRRSRRKALGISLVIETVLLGLVILIPLMNGVAQPHLRTSVYLPLALGSRHPTTPGPKTPPPRHPWTSHDVFTYWSGSKAPRPVAPIQDDTDDPFPPGEQLLPGEAATDAPMVMYVPRPNPIAPPEEIKKNSEKRPLKLSEGVVQAQLILRVEPRYPALAVQIHLQGAVQLRAIISREGRITSLEVVSGHPLFVQSALEAVRQWRYRPTMLNGEPVEVETTISVIFQLQK
jgi:protein TonB